MLRKTKYENVAKASHNAEPLSGANAIYRRPCKMMSLAGSDSFAVEHSKAEDVVKWMNDYTQKNNQKFHAKLSGYTLQTTKFGTFEMIAWSGDWSVARDIMQKASNKMRAKVIESGYHEKRDLLSAMFGSSSEFGKVYSNGKLIGQIETVKKSGKWIARVESFA